MGSPLRRLADLPPLLLAAWLIGALSNLWVRRLGYPYDLEWMEGGMLAHAWRLTHGLPLYVEPGPDFIPFVYPPGYAALLALIAQVTGLDYLPGRLISLVGTFAAAAALAVGVARQAGCRTSGVLAAAVFLGAYPASGAFYDLVRPDGLFLGLLAWSLVLGMERRRGAEIAAGLLLAAAFVVKHNAAAFGVPLALGLLARDGWRATVRFCLAAGLPALAFTVFMQIQSEGRFLVYLLEVPASHPNDWHRVMPRLPRELGNALPIAASAPALWFVLRLRTWFPGLHPAAAAALPMLAGIGFAWVGTTWWALGPELAAVPSAFAFWGMGAGAVAVVLSGGAALWTRVNTGSWRLDWRWVLAIGTLATGLIVAAAMRAHNGGYLNVYMHLHWLVAFAFGVVVARLRTTGALPWMGALAPQLFAGQLAWQLGVLDLKALAPTSADVQTGDAFVELLSRYDGPVLSPFAAWLPVQAGSAPSLHLIALWDLNHPGGPWFQEVERIRAALRRHHWEAAVDGTRPFGHGLLQHYEPVEQVPATGQTFLPRTGWVVRPARVLEPKAGDGP